MKNTIHAKIQWFRKEDGGREPPPPIDIFYSTIARFEAIRSEWPHVAWSLVLRFNQPFDENLSVIADVEFLSPDAPAELLQLGSAFDLFEGKQLVAHGIVIE